MIKKTTFAAFAAFTFAALSNVTPALLGASGDSGTTNYVLSINFSGGQRKNDQHYGALSGTDVFGTVPVRGDCWNNSYAATVAGMDGLLWNDGAVHANAEGVTLSYGSYTWANSATVVSGNLLHSYLDDTDINVTIDGLTEQNGFPRYCRVHVYMSMTLKSNIQFEPIVVNGTAYTWNGSAVCQGTTRWGNSSKVTSNEIALGWDYLNIGPIEIPADGRISITTFDYSNKEARGCIAAVQIEFDVPEAISVSASCAAGSGTIQLGDGEAGADVSVAGEFGEPVTTTMKATAADGFAFVRWRGPVGLFASGSATDAEVTVKTSMAAEFTAEFVMDNDVRTARWTGGGASGDLSDPENWACFNAAGAPLEGNVPGEGTTVVVAGETSFALPTNSSLHYAAIQFDNASLLSDSDMSGLDLAKVLGGSTIDLRGKTLTLLPADGSCNTEMTITDSSAVGTGGSLVLIAANGATFTNLGITLSGTLKLVKDGEGMYVPLKSGQTYTGGTHVKMGTVKLGTPLQPLGPCDKTQTVRVEKGATLDINRCRTGCFYNYELGGTIVHEGNARTESWDTQYLWMSRIELIDDAHISGGFFYFGSSDPSAPSILSLKGHTLYMDLAKGEVFAHGLEADATGGKMVLTAGALTSATVDLSSIDVAFTGDSYEFIASGDNGGELPVKGFAYERNYWKCHKGVCEIQVHGTYKAGAYRPPITLQDGAAIDISAENGCWSAEGILSSSYNPTKTDRAFSQPGQVSFADEATITVNLAGRADLKAIAEDDSPYIVTWSTPPADSVKFKLDAETRQRGYSVKVRSNGLALLPPRGFMLLVR